MPAVALGWGYAAIIARLNVRESLRVMRKEFVLTARAKGLAGGPVIYRHALKNALIPVVTMVGLQFGNMLSGSGGGGGVVRPTPGIVLLWFTGILTATSRWCRRSCSSCRRSTSTNLIVDLSYGLLDPRIRYS